MSSPNCNLTTLNRQELCDRIWTVPASKLAKEFGISDVGLAKVCKRHQIPRPPRGYWARLTVGKPARKQALPPIDDESLEEVRIFRQQFFADASLKVDAPAAPESTVQVPDSLSKPHPLVDRTRKYLRSVKAGDDKALAPDSKSCLQIRVSRASLDRALRIYDALVKHWESLGGSVVLGKLDINRKPTAQFELQGDGVPVELYEEIDRISTQPADTRGSWKYHNCKYQPTGRLVLKVDDFAHATRTRWADGKRQQLEKKVGAVPEALMAILEGKRLHRLDEECRSRQQTAVKTVREQAAKRKQLTEELRTQLLADISAWRQAGEIRSFLTMMSSQIDSGELLVNDKGQFTTWKDWAMWYADSIDPLVLAPPRAEYAGVRTNKATSELDLTRATRAVVSQLGVSTTDELFEIEQSAVEKLCGRWRTTEWNEICRVLEGLEYQVADRYRGYSI